MSTEFLYKLNQRTGPAPKIRKLGATKMGMEQTPVDFDGQPVIVESMAPDAVCPRQYIRCRNLKTGEISAPFGLNYHFASAFAEGDTLYVFATSTLDDLPMTIYQSEDASSWHDPRGGHTVRMFRSKDTIHWEEKDILTAPDRRLWNTSVCRGEDCYMMAVEVRGMDGQENIPQIGEPFTVFFARSTDMENWEWLPDDASYTKERYNACPALRYADGWYYMICLERLPCVRYAPYIYRTRNFFDWQVGFHNPMMLWSDEDRIPKEGCTFTEEELDILQNGLNINCSDIDLMEIDGKTHIYYANGDQMTYSFLCEAVYEGPLNTFLRQFFE